MDLKSCQLVAVVAVLLATQACLSDAQSYPDLQINPANLSTTPYVSPLFTGFNDTISLQLVGRAPAINALQVLFTLAPCAYRYPHYHAFAWELLCPLKGTLGFGNIEANNTITVNLVPKGYIIQQPQANIHFVFNPRCIPVRFSSVFNALVLGTYDVQYAQETVPYYAARAYFKKKALVRSIGRKGVSYDPICLKKCGLPIPPDVIA